MDSSVKGNCFGPWDQQRRSDSHVGRTGSSETGNNFQSAACADATAAGDPDLESADHIVALKKAEHFSLLQERFPSWIGTSDPSRIEYWHIHDIDQMAPEEGLPLIATEVQSLMKRLR
jgi:protein-tyrosine phosphatase